MELSKMDVSIIIPAYNAALYIEKTLQNLQAKTASFEIILVDDGSTDNTRYTVQNFVSQTGIPVKYLYQNNSGVSVARNTGIANSSGDFIAFLDSDDFVSSNYIDTMFNAAKLNNTDMVTCMYNHVWPNGKMISLNYEKYINIPSLMTSTIYLEYFLLNTTILNTGSLLIKSSVIKDNQIFFDTSMTHCEDHKLYIECILKSKSVFYVKEILYNYVQREGSLTHSPKLELLADTVYLYVRLLERNKRESIFNKTHITIIESHTLPEAIEFMLYSSLEQNNTVLFYKFHKDFSTAKYLLKQAFAQKILLRKRITSIQIALFPTIYCYRMLMNLRKNRITH